MLLTTLAAIVGGGLFAATTVGMHMNNEDARKEIRSIRKDAEEKIESSKEMLSRAKQKCNSSLTLLNKRKKDIYDTTFKTFTENAKKITNIDFNDRVNAVNKIESINIQTKQVTRYSLEPSDSALGNAMDFIAGIGLGGGWGLGHELHQSFELDKIKAKTKAEAEKINLEYELVRKECVKLNSITGLVKTTISTVDTLKKLADKAVAEMLINIEQAGTNFSKYTESVKEQLWITFKLIDAINKLLNMEIVGPNGGVSTKYRKYVGELTTELLREKYKGKKNEG